MGRNRHLKKTTRLSNSAINTVNSCSEKYRLHYIEKIRPTTKTSALIFGDAMDKAYESLLLKKDDYLDVFNSRWSYNKIEDDGPEVDIAENINMRYSKADYDSNLLLPEDKMLLGIKADELKIIVYNKSDFDWAEKHAAMVSKTCRLYLQPEWSKSAAMLPKIIDYIKAHPQWELSLQIHKFIDVP